ncbi:hypothetical protein HPP92_021362 [Vanilla planifolia]|uniref:EF-hand domain-containing protein n=1 Tax=Vanilla planifolia TaxID=51239 RepID=A0A835Q2D4_VANPL|nr:hypothetical protein HPP92_021699 [Vanilla planifolia]KAG0462886.1 hypothetical protein HPP92_021362 [Vanilla planifolia]
MVQTATISGVPLLARIRCALSLKKPRNVPSLPLSPPPPGRGLEQVFRHFDEDGDGRISAEELCSCLGRVDGGGLSPAEAEAMVESYGGGKMEYEDFVRLVHVEEEERGRVLREAFAAYEMEGMGCITARSLRRAFRRLGEEKSVRYCREMIRRFDFNGDGVISFEEFKVMML